MADRRMWKMSPERLQEHLKLRSRASRIPDKKKEQSKKACRNTRRAFPQFWRGKLLGYPQTFDLTHR